MWIECVDTDGNHVTEIDINDIIVPKKFIVLNGKEYIYNGATVKYEEIPF